MAGELCHDQGLATRWRWLSSELWAHLRRNSLKYTVPILGIAVLTHYFTFALNLSESLKGHVFLVAKQANHLGDFSRGDYITFRWHGGGGKPAGIWFTKIVRGVPGDQVTTQGPDGRTIAVHGQIVGFAKPLSRDGKIVLEPASPGVVPDRSFFVAGTHPDSLDSRYRVGGYVQEGEIIGKAWLLW